MTENPLLQKYFELHPEKKEKPKMPRIEDYEGEKTIADEIEDYEFEIKTKNIQHTLDPKFVEQLKDVETLSTVASITGNTGTGITASNYVSATNSSVSYKPLMTYNVAEVSRAFLEVADKVNNGTAQVVGYIAQMDMVGSFAAGKKITFEVYVYD